MGRKRDRFQWVVDRLDAWGAYTAYNNTGLGYPSRTAESRAADGDPGSHTNYQDHSPNVKFAHREHETHRAVLRLPDEQQTVMWMWYVGKKKPEEISSAIRKSQRFVYDAHEKALWFLAGAIPQEKLKLQN